MALWVILEILDQGETQDSQDHRETKGDMDSAMLDREDPQETEVIRAEKAPEAVEGLVGPKERLGQKDCLENQGSLVSWVIREREDPEESQVLMGIRGPWAILASLSVMS